MYRPKQVYNNGLPLKKRIVNKIEKANKILLLRLFGKLLRVKKIHSPIPLENVNSVLIIRYDALGDMIVTTPLWRILKRLKPSIKIGVAGSSKNLGLLRDDTDIDVIYDYSAQSFFDFFRITKKTRKTDWDIVLMCKFNQKTRGAMIAGLSTSTGVTATIGSANAEGHQALFSRLVSLPQPEREMQMTEQVQFLLRSIIALPIETNERPSIIVSNTAETLTHQRIKTILQQDSLTSYIVLNTDAPEVRKWGIKNNILLAQYISDHHTEYTLMVTSLPENHHELEMAMSSIPRVHYFATRDVLELTTLIRFSSLVITPDTGTAHIVSAESKPIIGLYPEAGEWLPYKIPSYILIPKKGESINTIPVSMVATAVTTMLSEIAMGKTSFVNIIRCQTPDIIETREFIA